MEGTAFPEDHHRTQPSFHHFSLHSPTPAPTFYPHSNTRSNPHSHPNRNSHPNPNPRPHANPTQRPPPRPPRVFFSQRPAIGLPPASRARNAPLPSSSGGAEPAKLLGQTGGGVAASATPKIERLSNRSSSSGAFEKAVAEAAAAVDCAGNGGGRGGVGRKGAGGRVSGVLANAAVGVVSAGGKAFGRTSLVSHLRGGMGGAASNSSLNSSPISTEEMSSLDMAVSSGGRGATTRIARTMSSASPSSAAAANSGTSPTVAGGANSRGRGDARGLPPPSPYGDNGGGNGASSGGGYRSGALLGSGEDEKRRGGTGGAESWSGPNGLKRGVAMYPGEMEGGAPGSGGRGGTGGERPPSQGNPLNAGIFSPFPPPGSGRRRGRGAGTGDGGGIGTEGGGGGVGGARTPSYVSGRGTAVFFFVFFQGCLVSCEVNPLCLLCFGVFLSVWYVCSCAYNSKCVSCLSFSRFSLSSPSLRPPRLRPPCPPTFPFFLPAPPPSPPPGPTAGLRG